MPIHAKFDRTNFAIGTLGVWSRNEVVLVMILVGGSSVTPEMHPQYVSVDIVECTAHAIDDLDAIKAVVQVA